MGSPREAPQAALFAAVMHRPLFDPQAILDRLADLYGPVEHRSPPYPFDHSDYYLREMGPGLLKFLVSFGPPVPQDRLAPIKLRTNDLERDAAGEGGRVVNIDPGIVNQHSVVLATTKGHAHRIYMGQGIYQELTLLFARGTFEPLPWTYPDYRTPAVLDFLRAARESLRSRLAVAADGRAC